MREKIIEAVAAQERKRQVRILFAVESGSRAWGFSSPDSDYDIRGVYVPPVEWYFKLDEKKSDTFLEMLPGDLDVACWEIGKALFQFKKCNPSFLSWLGSPIVYSDRGFLARLRELIPDVFNPVRVACHFAAMHRKAMEDLGDDGQIRIKKLCYAMRANLCVRWVFEHESMPPTAFADVRRGVTLSSEEDSAISGLLSQKATAAEGFRLPLPSGFGRIVENQEFEIATRAWRNREPRLERLAELESLFKNEVLGSRT